MLLHAVKKPAGEAGPAPTRTRTEGASPERKADSPRVPPFRFECCVLHDGEQNSRLFPLVLTKMPFPQFLHVAGTQPYR